MTESQQHPKPEDPKAAEPSEASAEPYKAFANEEDYRTHLQHVTQDRTARAKERAVGDLLERFEVEDADELEQIVSEYKVIREATQSETQQIEERAAKAEKKQTELKEILKNTEAQREQISERTQVLEDKLKGLIKPQLEAVPELYRPFVESMGVEEQAEWLSENAEKLGTQNGSGRPAGSRPTGRPQQVPKNETDKEARERQRQARVSAI